MVPHTGFVRQSSRVRVCIKSIEVDFRAPRKCPINLKVLAPGKAPYNLKVVNRDQALCWMNLNPIDVNLGDFIEIRVYELRWFERKRERLGSVKFQAQNLANSQPVFTIRDEAGNSPLSISVRLVGEPNSESVQRVHAEASGALASSSSTNRSVARTRDIIATIQRIGDLATQFIPIIEPAIALCTQTLEAIKQYDPYDSPIADLIEKMGNTLALIPSVEDYAKYTGLQNTIVELIRLVEDASRFVLSHKYKSSVWGQSSGNRAHVDEFTMKFEILAKEFDRGMTAHVIQRVEVILSDGDLALVDKLVIPGAYYDPAQCCLQGTRAQLLDKIEKWVHGGDASNPFFWIYGPAGCGKTSLASSIAKRLDHAGILAGSFFCKRDQEQLKSPENVVSSLAASLARECQPYAAQLVMALRKNRQLMDSATRTRFEGLVVNPITELDERLITGKLVVVIDAVDECGTAHTRKELLRCLFEMSQVSGWLKVLVTSRPNDEIRCAMDSIAARITRHDLFAGGLASVSDDITSYLRYRMGSIAGPVRENQLWPSEFDVRQLAVRSNNLFIWARTVCDLVEQSFDPVSTLERVLSGEQSTDAKRALDNVYSTALSESLGNAMDGVATVRLCVGAIVLTGALNPLSDAALAALLRKRISSCSLSRVIDRLGSVLYRDDDGLVRVLHHSFSDYMTESGCPEHYRIDLGIQNAEMTIACLELMIRSLRFNICGLEDSYIMNREVPNLQNRIERAIPPELAYSCVYWANHLVASTRNKAATINALLDELTSGSQLLYWVEVLSLLGRTGTALTSMAQLIDWTSDTESRFAESAADMYRFISAAYVPISSSTPHLYVSALPFGTANYETLRKMGSQFPNTLSVSAVRGLWNVQCLHSIKENSEILSVAISSDGQRIVTGGLGNSIRIWDMHTYTEVLQPLQGHSDSVTSVTFSPDGRRIASGSWDKTLCIWDAETGAILCGPLGGHSRCVTALVFSPRDGRRIISSSRDGTLRIWDTHTGVQLLDTLRGHSDVVSSVALSPDGQYIGSGSWDQTIRIWDAYTGIEILHPLRGHTDLVTSVAFSPDGQHIISGSHDQSVRIWDAHSGAALLSPIRGHTHWVTSVAFSPDGQYIVSGSDDHTIKIWSAKSGVPILDPLQGHSDSITNVLFSPDGRLIVSGSEDSTIRVWDTHLNINSFGPLHGHSANVTSIAFSPDGQFIVSGSGDSKVQVWNVHTGTPLFEPLEGHRYTVQSVTFSPDGGRIASASTDWTVRIWDAKNGIPVIKPLCGHTGSVMSIAFSSDGRQIVSGSWDCTIRVWDAYTGVALLEPFIGHSSCVQSVCFSPNTQRIASGSYDNTVRIWDSCKGVEATLPLLGHRDMVTSVCFSPGGQRVVSASYDLTVRIWDAYTGAELFAPLQGHSLAVTSLAFSPDGQHIASGSRDKTIRIWNSYTGDALPNVSRGHTAHVTTVAFSPDGRYIASGSWDWTVLFWDVQSPSIFTPTRDILSSARATHETRIVSSELCKFLDSESWVCGPHGERIFWLPPSYQQTRANYSRHAISAKVQDHPITFDLSKLSVGSNWTQVHGQPDISTHISTDHMSLC